MQVFFVFLSLHVFLFVDHVVDAREGDECTQITDTDVIQINHSVLASVRDSELYVCVCTAVPR